MAAADVPIEIRGAGQATRQVTNFLAPGAFDAVDRLICCEVLTPGGELVVLPAAQARRHAGLAREQRGDLLLPGRPLRLDRDERARASRSIARTPPTAPSTRRSSSATATSSSSRAATTGPRVAAPGYPLYYLNVMAGPNPERTMAIVDDPPYGWIRDTWQGDADRPALSDDDRRRGAP